MSVVVVGGGIVGASIAWHLAQRTNVTIIAEEVGGIATPNSFAWINAAGTEEDYYFHFRHRSMQRWVEIGKDLPDLPIHWGGTLSWDKTPEELAERQALGIERGVDVIRVDQTQKAKLEPELTDDFFPEWDWGLYVREEGSMEAHVVAAQLIAQAEALGATLLKTSVTGFLKLESGRVCGVSTKNGTVHSDHVVLAAGLGSVPLLATENIALPLKGREGLLANTAPVDKQYLNTLVNTPTLHLRQTLDGRLRFGADFAGGPIGDDPQGTAEKLFERMRKAFKTGDELDFGYYTIGVRPDPEDGYPILGSTGLDGLDVAVMHSGVTNAALVGDLLTRKILDNVSDPILAHFQLDRFSKNSTSS